MVVFKEKFHRRKSSVSNGVLPKNLKRVAEGGCRVRRHSKRGSNCCPLVTVITAVLNGGEYLEQTIRSVLCQTYENIEYIIIDGGSTDNTSSILRNYDNEIDYWVSEPDQGVYDAWNKAISCSNGEWICFIGSDDYWANGDMLQKLMQAAIRCEADLISGKGNIIDECGHVKRVIGRSWEWDEMKKWQVIFHPGMLHKFTLFEKFGLFDTKLEIAGDYEWLLRLGGKIKAVFIDTSVINMREIGISNSNISKTIFETYKVQYAHKDIGAAKATTNMIISWAKVYIRNIIK